MKKCTQILISVMMLLSVASGQSKSPGHVVFVSSSGSQIDLNIRVGTLDTPRSHSTRLQDCSDDSQVCLTDHNGFAFAFFKKCTDTASWKDKRLRFRPKVVSALHNDDIWLVFDASPNYLFHYAYSKGIVGINIGPTDAFDFRSVFRTKRLDWPSLDATEYRIKGPDTVAACSAAPDASALLPIQQSTPATDTLLHESGHVGPPKPQ